MSLDTILTDYDLWLFNTGKNFKSYEKMGAHIVPDKGVHFAVWAPNSKEVSVVGDFNNWNLGDWNERPNYLNHMVDSGIHWGFVKDAKPGDKYKFAIRTDKGHILAKADPFAFLFESGGEHPKYDSASVIYDLNDFKWTDLKWMQNRHRFQGTNLPISTYEVHSGSWKFIEDNQNWRTMDYQELADSLVPYVKEQGFTHIELMPVMEHPYGGSWGYQSMGFFAPSSRWGNPKQLKYLINKAHENNLGVILDWAPAHFATDETGISNFDGTEPYGHEDPNLATHPKWKSKFFNYHRDEVSSFLISSASFWAEKYHADGIRVDAVATILNPSLIEGQSNPAAIKFLKSFNETLHNDHPSIITIAEDSSTFPMVTMPPEKGGLGFNFKWSLGWMHDTLDYLSEDPINRGGPKHDIILKSREDLGKENYVSPLSHDECVHGESSIVNKMQGEKYKQGMQVDDWQKFADLRAMYGYMFSYPGKKLLFMGNEFGQTNEWDYQKSLDWHLLEEGPYHKGIKKLVQDLNHIYSTEPALYEVEASKDGFEWIDWNDREHSTLSFTRYSKDKKEVIVITTNFTPVVREGYRIGVDDFGYYNKLINTDSEKYGGSNVLIPKDLHSDKIPMHGRPYSVMFTLPPLATIWLKPKK